MMGDMDTVDIELRGLESLTKALKGKPPLARVGVLAKTTQRHKVTSNSAPTNAAVGAVHEFGDPVRGLPQRSWLRAPIVQHLDKEIEKSGLFDKDALAQVIQTSTMVPWMRKVAILAEAVIDDAFETSGNGQWPAWKDPNYTNQSGMILVDTGSLRDSVTSEVLP